MNKLNKGLNLILTILPIVAIFIIWALASLVINNQYILPSLGQTFSALILVLRTKSFYIAFFNTFLRSLISFLISFILAVLLAYLTHKSKIAEKVVLPIIIIMRALPTIAIALLLVFWVNSFIAPIIVTMLVVFPTIYTMAKNAFDGVDREVLEMSAVCGANKFQTFKHIIVPLVLPEILVIIGSNLSLNLKLMVAAEVLSSTANSIGLMLNTSKVFFELAPMLAIIIICVLFGLVIEFIFNSISKKVGEWK